MRMAIAFSFPDTVNNLQGHTQSPGALVQSCFRFGAAFLSPICSFFFMASSPFCPQGHNAALESDLVFSAFLV